MKKRIVSILMTLVMMLGLLPTAALATEEPSESAQLSDGTLVTATTPITRAQLATILYRYVG